MVSASPARTSHVVLWRALAGDTRFCIASSAKGGLVGEVLCRATGPRRLLRAVVLPHEVQTPLGLACPLVLLQVFPDTLRLLLLRIATASTWPKEYASPFSVPSGRPSPEGTCVGMQSGYSPLPDVIDETRGTVPSVSRTSPLACAMFVGHLLDNTC